MTITKADVLNAIKRYQRNWEGMGFTLVLTYQEGTPSAGTAHRLYVEGGSAAPGAGDAIVAAGEMAAASAAGFKTASAAAAETTIFLEGVRDAQAGNAVDPDAYRDRADQLLANAQAVANSIAKIDIASAGYTAMIEFIKKGNLPTAFFIATDTIATGVLKALYENKISVPNDISLIGFNDIFVSRYTLPALSTVRVHIENMSNACVGLMLERLNNRNYTKKVIIPSQLIIRESTSSVSNDN